MADVWRRGSGLSLRRLWVLLMGLPGDSEFWRSYHRAQEKAAETVTKAPDEANRARLAYYTALAAGDSPPTST